MTNHYNQDIIKIAQNEIDWPADVTHPMGSSQANPYESWDARHRGWLDEWHIIDSHISRPVEALREAILARVASLDSVKIEEKLAQIAQKDLDKQREQQRLDEQKEELRKDEDLMLKRSTFAANWPGPAAEVEEFWLGFISGNADDKSRYDRLRAKN